MITCYTQGYEVIDYSKAATKGTLVHTMSDAEFRQHPNHMAIVVDNKFIYDNVTKYGMHIHTLGHVIGWTPGEMANQIEAFRRKNPKINIMFHTEVLSEGPVDPLLISWYGTRYFPSQKEQKVVQNE